MEIARTALDFIAEPIFSVTPLTGGAICHTAKITTATRAYVYKYLANAPTNFFQQEAMGLQTLASTHCFHTPHVFLAADHFLLLEYITPSAQPNWQQLGTQLAHLHQQHHSAYGFFHANFLATVPQNNHWQKNWIAFYRQQRLVPLLQHPLFNKQDRQAWEILLNKLENYLDNSEPPALIHGDLWHTNIIFADEIYLIDPAVCYASREMEIAYLEFVGDDHPDLLQAYQQYYPLSKDYSERKNFYLLYPYLVHLHLFGAAYLSGIRNILQYYT